MKKRRQIRDTLFSVLRTRCQESVDWQVSVIVDYNELDYAIESQLGILWISLGYEVRRWMLVNDKET